MDEMDAMKYFNRKDYRNALAIYLSMLQDAEKEGDREKIAYTSNLAGLCYYFLHSHSEAREYFNKALEHTEGEEHQKVQKNIDEMERYIKSVKEDIEKISSLLEEENDETRKGILYSNLGILKYFMGSTEEAEEAFTKAEKIFKKSGNRIALGAIYSNFALIYDDLRALDYLYRALDIFTEEGHLKGQADVYHSLSLHYLYQDNLEESYYFLKKELEIVDKIDDREIKRRCYELAADITMDMGKVNESMHFTELASRT